MAVVAVVVGSCPCCASQGEGCEEARAERTAAVMFPNHCPACARPLAGATCPRCDGGIESLTRAILAAGNGRILFAEAYELAKRVAERERVSALFLDVTAREFAA